MIEFSSLASITNVCLFSFTPSINSESSGTMLALLDKKTAICSGSIAFTNTKPVAWQVQSSNFRSLATLCLIFEFVIRYV